MNDEYLDFLVDTSQQLQETELETLTPWIVGIIDDEPLVHEATLFALADVEIAGRSINFVSAHSAQAGFELIQQHPDMAVVLLDVVMESEDSGLLLVDRIRNELNNHFLQIILRTGQPGDVPEEELITRYEINSYKNKNELTRVQLFTTIAAAIRSYQLLAAIEDSRNGLRQIIQATADFLQERSVSAFSSRVLNQFQQLFNISQNCIFCVTLQPANGPIAINSSDENVVLVAASQSLKHLLNREINQLDEAIFTYAEQIFAIKEHQFKGDFSGLYFSTPSGWEGVIVTEQNAFSSETNEELLQVFCTNVALGLENAKYFTHLNKAAYKDELTGLNNRAGFIEQADLKLQTRHTNQALYLLDIDYFHQVITSLGYEFGNKILKKMATTIVQLFDSATIIGRLHSDVFALLVEGTPLSAREVAAKCSRPMLIEGQSIRMGLTVGMSINRDEQGYVDDVSKLIRRSEMALHVAKDHKRGAGETFDASYEIESYRSMMILSDIRGGLTRKELFLVLQPKVNITKNNHVIGFEALIRWNHPKSGLIPPGAFIPSVEKSGMYYELDLYVANALCLLLNAYPQINVPVSFNISANSLNHESFVGELTSIFRKHKIDAKKVEIEVTENALIHSDLAIARINELNNAGFEIDLDDFGAGFSSLAYLLRLPLNTIKIDRSFVVDIVDQPKSYILLEGIISIIAKLNKNIVVEGVETKQQNDLLMALGVQTVQGFLFHKPLPVEEAMLLLNSEV